MSKIIRWMILFYFCFFLFIRLDLWTRNEQVKPIALYNVISRKKKKRKIEQNWSDWHSVRLIDSWFQEIQISSRPVITFDDRIASLCSSMNHINIHGDVGTYDMWTRNKNARERYYQIVANEVTEFFVELLVFRQFFSWI